MSGIIDVRHEHQDGWHEFTSPQIPGLYVVCETDRLEDAFGDIPRAIEELVFMDYGRKVKVVPKQTFSEYLSTLPPEFKKPVTKHYEVEDLTLEAA